MCRPLRALVLLLLFGLSQAGAVMASACGGLEEPPAVAAADMSGDAAGAGGMHHEGRDSVPAVPCDGVPHGAAACTMIASCAPVALPAPSFEGIRTTLSRVTPPVGDAFTSLGVTHPVSPPPRA